MTPGKSDSPIKRNILHVAMVFLALLAIVPMYVVIINATRTTEQINTGLAILPGKGAFTRTITTIVADWGDTVVIEGTEGENPDYQITVGTIRFYDLNPGRTLMEEVNQKTGEKELRVNRAITDSLLPRIAIVDYDGNRIANYNLADGTILHVNNGASVRKGDVLAVAITRPTVLSNWLFLTGRGFQIWRGFANSAFISICATLLSVYFSALTAYGLHVYRFKGRTVIWVIILIIMMLPGSLTFIGFYQLMVRMHLTNTYVPLIIPGIAAAATVLFIRQYMSSVLNMELIDAARIDGAGEYRIFNIIILPVVIPALAAQAIFTFVGSWNNFLTPTVILNEINLFTLPLLVDRLRGDIYRTEFGAIYLGISVSLIPIIIFYAFMSRFIISGITMGGIKE